MKSPCCQEKLEVQYGEEMYHGCDDEYALMIPYLVCTKCGVTHLQASKEEINELVAI
ncbi:hypothetical protein [Robertmurraya korlensis]|jgi:hypothetical protein|uniref:hypothetical protein n=1 Tax=Robertmurraya korlensis TaxID=519977 RepID=UPI000B1977CF|nr:hypothetical protein [Robertmurraya korlensis]